MPASTMNNENTLVYRNPNKAGRKYKKKITRKKAKPLITYRDIESIDC